MTIYRDEILCAVDPEQSFEAAGRPQRGVSVVMRDEEASSPGGPEPSVCVLSAAEARRLAFELLEAAELCEREGGRR